jgi:hypothetical protein
MAKAILALLFIVAEEAGFRAPLFIDSEFYLTYQVSAKAHSSRQILIRIMKS